MTPRQKELLELPTVSFVLLLDALHVALDLHDALPLQLKTVGSRSLALLLSRLHSVYLCHEL